MTQRIRLSRSFVVPALLVLAAGRAVSVHAQEPPPAAEDAVAPAIVEQAVAPGAKRTLSFNFKDTPFDQVLDFVARQTGLPVIRESEAPKATLTFISAGDYTLEEAFDVLNRLLWIHGVQVRRENEFILLSKIEDMRALGKVLGATIPEEIGSAEVITIVVPMNNAAAAPTGEQLKPLLSRYGAIVPLPAQNALVITDTASQCRRLRDIIGRLDAQPPKDQRYQIFPLRHARSDTILQSLTGLVAERRSMVIIDKDGNQKTVKDDKIEGLSLEADRRTNSIIAVGPEARLKVVEDLVALLDTPGGADQREMTTFALSSVGVDEAAEALNRLFERRGREGEQGGGGPGGRGAQPRVGVEADPRPTIVPMRGQAKVAVIGSADQLAQAQVLLSELDPASSPTNAAASPGATPEARVASLRLEHVKPEAAQALASRLLSPRQASMLRIAPAPDGKGLIAMGPPADVESLRALVQGFDAPPQREVFFRMLTVGANASPELVAERALAALRAEAAGDPTLTLPHLTADKESGTISAVADATTMQRLERIVGELTRQSGPARDLRMLELRHAKAADVVAFISELVRSTKPFTGLRGPEPVLEAIEATNSVMVAADPVAQAIIQQLVARLDSQSIGERPPLRILKLRSTDAGALAQTLQQTYGSRPIEQRTKMPVEITADVATNMLLVSAHPAALTEIESLVQGLNEADVLDESAREVRIYPLKVARAEELAATIEQMFPEAPVPLDPRTRQPRPDLRPPRDVVVRADRATNSLIVDGVSTRLANFEQIIEQLDKQRLPGNVELRSYRLKRAQPDAIANSLRALGAQGALTGGTPSPSLMFSAEPVTRTLLVTGPGEAFEHIERVLEELDAAPDRPESTLVLYSLTHSKADRLQPMLTRLLTARFRERVEAEPEEWGGVWTAETASLLDVSSDVATNTVLVSAPEPLQRIAAELVRTLDTPAPGGAAEVRVFPLKTGKAESVARAIAAGLAPAAAPGEPAPVVTAEASSNCIVVTATAARMGEIESLLKSLDGAVAPDGVGVRTVRLTHGRAESIAPVVEGLLRQESFIDKLPQWERGQYLLRAGEGAPPVRVAAEPRLNAIVVTGPLNLVGVAEEIIRGLDIASTQGTASRSVRVITLRNAEAAAAAENIEAILKDEAGEGAPPPTVRVDQGSNSLIIRGTREQIELVEGVVKTLDDATISASREMRMISVDRSRADAAMMAEALKRMLEQRGGTRVRVISADELLNGRPQQDHDSGRPGSPGSFLSPGIHIHRLAPFIIAQSLAIASVPQQEREPDITIAVDPRTNSLIVSGSPRAAERVAALVAELQRQMPAEPRFIRIVSLPQGVDAQPIAQVVEQTVRQIGRSSAENPGGFVGPVSVQADPDGSALIVSAGDTDFESLSQLIAAIARPGPSDALSVKVYPLENVEPEDAMRSVRDLLSFDPRGRQARRVLEVTIDRAGGPITALVEASSVRMSVNPGRTSLVVAAPRAAIPLIDSFISLLDQAPAEDRAAIRRLEVKNARAMDTARTLQSAFDAAHQSASRSRGSASATPPARFVADERTNALLVTATEPQFREVERLLTSLDVPVEDDRSRVAIIPLQLARPGAVKQIVETILIGRDAGRDSKLRISASEESSLLVVRAGEEDLAEVQRIVAEVDKAETTGLPIRTIKLQRADAEKVSRALQRFFEDRARASSRPGGRAIARQVAIVGDKRTSTLVVSCSDEDFEQIVTMASTFDSPATGQDMQFRVIPLQHARVSEVRDSLDDVVWQIKDTGSGAWWYWGQQSENEEVRLSVAYNDRANSVIVMGTGEAFQVMERVVASLDSPPPEGTRLAIRAVRLVNADPRVVGPAISRALSNPNWPRWRGDDPDGVRAEVDARSSMIMLIGREDRLEEAARLAVRLDSDVGGTPREMHTQTLKFARAERVAQGLERFFRDRADARGAGGERVSILGSPDGNVVIVQAPADEMALVRDMLAQMDAPEEDEGRVREVFTLRNADPVQVAQTLREQFPRPRGQRDGGSGEVIVTPQSRAGTVIVSAPQEVFERVSALVRQLDAPPSLEASRIVTVTLSSARAEDAAAALSAAMPAGVKVIVTPVRRTNSVLLTGSDESIAIAMEQLKRLDEQPAASPIEFRRIPLAHADVTDVAITLRQLVGRRQTAPNEQPPAISTSTTDNAVLISAESAHLEEIARIVRELDVPAAAVRTTEFVPLRFADAKATANALEYFYGRYAPEAATPAARNVTIIANPLSKSLVISAEQAEWPGIRSLLEKLDNEQYDTSRQLRIIALRHADAASLARTLTEAFTAPLRAQVEREQARRGAQGRGNGRDDGPQPPTVLVDAAETVSVVAEALTNSLVVSASKETTDKIAALVAQLDVPEFARLPEARIIPLKVGPASQIAATLRQMFTEIGGTGQNRFSGGRSVVIVGDDKASALVVRAEEAQFAQISAMAEALQAEGDRSRASVRLLPLRNIPAGRLAQSLRTAFQPVAQQKNEPLVIELDRTSNALVVASSENLFKEVKALAEELDRAVPGAPEGGGGGAVPGMGQSMQVVDVEHTAPDRVREMLERIGVTRPVPQDRAGIVGEPVQILTLLSRRSIVIIGTPADVLTVASLARTLDASPSAAMAEQHLSVVPLRTARAEAVAESLTAMLTPRNQQAGTEIADSLAEQVRRLSIHRTGADQPNLAVDLSKPVAIRADATTNSIILSSTEANVVALTQVIELLDRLPIGDAVVVRFFPLQNASATRVGGVVRDLFAQGDRLRTSPTSQVRTMPSTEIGKALAVQPAVTVDERTNTLVVAGREESVAMVEVLVKQLDGERVANWVEPRLIRLEHADPVRLAQMLERVLVQGAAGTPEEQSLQRQIGRLRVPRTSDDGGQTPAAPIDADRFVPISTLVILPESNLRALIVVGSRANADAVAELAKMLDVPAAAADNSVRIYPLRVAAADRVERILREMFRGQVDAGALLPQDDLVITTDVRTNSLVVSTSPRSFAIVEGLIQRLDAEAAGPTVGVSVIPVPTGDVSVLAPRIERLMRDRIESSRRGGGIPNPSDTFSIQPDPSTRSLIVAASEENTKIIRDLVAVLVAGGEALSAGIVTDVVVVSSSRASDLAGAVNELYVEQQNRQRGADAVRVASNERLNALVVRGSPADVEAVRTLVARLDSQPIANVTEIKRIELTKADAGDVVRLLQNVLAGRPLAGTGVVGQRKAQVLRFLRAQQAEQMRDDGAHPEVAGANSPTEAEISGAIQEQVTLTAELRTNSIVVVAPSRLMVLVEALVADLDTTMAGGRAIRVFKLTNADARTMSDVLRELFNLRQQGSTLVLVPERFGDTPGLGANMPSDSVGGGTDLFPSPDERQALAITVDPRTNSLLVSGTPEYLERVAQVVEELDSIEAQEREQVIYELRNAKAPQVATTIRDYFQDQANKARSTLRPDQAGSLLRILEREVTVQGDGLSNRLIVGVSPKYREMVDTLVKELDSTPPQVMIQVLLAEVTLDSSNQWGVDVKVGPFGGEGYMVGALGAGAGVTTALGVPNLSVSSTDFELLIRALEAQGRLEVLSRPQVLVNNNELARIQVGEDIAIVTNVSRSPDTGRTDADVTRQDIGVILSVTPTISADGFVRMDIQPEISSLSARTTAISEDFEAPIINRRVVDTNVTVRDGETIVIGGLIQSTEIERRTKIPLLGDIPFAGEFFKSQNYTQTRTELLVLLSPRVIRAGSDHDEDVLRGQTIVGVERIGKNATVRKAFRPEAIDVKVSTPETIQPETRVRVPYAPFDAPRPEPVRPPEDYEDFETPRPGSGNR